MNQDSPQLVSANVLLPSPVIKPASEECNDHTDFLKAWGLKSPAPVVTYTDTLARGQPNIPSAEISQLSGGSLRSEL